MSRDPTLLDTNVLIYALYKDSGYFPAARALLDQAKQEDAGFCITPQVLAEFYAVVTHPKRVTHPKSPEEALTVTMRGVAAISNHPGFGGEAFDSSCLKACDTGRSVDFREFEVKICGAK